MNDDTEGQASDESSLATQVTLLGGVFLLGLVIARLLGRVVTPPTPLPAVTTPGVFSLNTAKTGLNFQPTGSSASFPIEDLIEDTPGGLQVGLVFALRSPSPGTTLPAPDPDRVKFLALLTQFLATRATFTNKVQGSSSCCRH